jgi:hypothetical protein
MLNEELVQVRLYGGLGNQLFQFFAGLDLALKNGTPLHLDLSWLDEKSQSVNLFSDPALKSLDFPIYVVNNPRSKFLDKTLGNRILRDLKIPTTISHIHVPKEVGFSETYGLPRKIELRGYYQSYKYLDRSRQKISLDAFFTNRGKNLEDEATKKIAVHIRGGDYLDLQDLYYKLDIDYYNNAIQVARSIYPDLPVVVFTNDVEHVRILFRSSSIEYSIFNDENMDPQEILENMSQSSAIIGANSTFSFWAAQKSGESVPKIFPSRWFQRNRLPKMLYPSDWIILD